MTGQHLTKSFLIASYFIVFFVKCESNELSQGNHESSEESWIVHTNSGPVEGSVTRGFSGKEVYVFYGIPYAEPPVKELRFQRPQPVKPWTDVLQATKKPLPCYQHYSGRKTEFSRNDGTLVRRPWSEDCLTLNIWTPKPKAANEPVLVLFHSGAFLVGSNIFPFMDGSTLSAHAHGVVVTMNYRLGAFGFLIYGVPEAPGNVGLFDQQMALKWVHENVQHFGGQQDGITIVGTGGAGSASVGYHLIFPGSEDFFKNSAYIGGAPTCPWAFQDREDSLNVSKTLSARLSCTRVNVEEELACLRAAHPEDIVDATLSGVLSTWKYFRPTVDGTFITEPPSVALKAGHFSRKPALVWTESHEGSELLLSLNPRTMAHPEKGLDISGFRKVLKRLAPDLSEDGMGIAEDYYIDKCHPDDHSKIRDGAIRLYSDVLFDCCVNQFVDYIAENGGQVTRTVDELLRQSDPAWFGASHGSSSKYVLGYPLAPELHGYSKAEANMSAHFILWINDHTKRSVKEVDENLQWYTIESKPYVYWDAIGPNYYHRYREEHCNLWNNIMPNFQEHNKKCES